MDLIRSPSGMAYKALCDLYSGSSPLLLSSSTTYFLCQPYWTPDISAYFLPPCLIRLFIYVYHVNKDLLSTSTLISYLLLETFPHTITLTPDLFSASSEQSLTLHQFLLSYSSLLSCHSFLLFRPSLESWWFYSSLCPRHLVMCQVHSGCCLASWLSEF